MNTRVIHKCRWFWGWSYVLIFLDGIGIGRVQISDDEPGVAYILGVSVLPENQGQGIGRRLMLELESLAWSLGSSEIRLTSEKQHPFTLGWYKRMGYDVYTEDRDLWYMSKEK